MSSGSTARFSAFCFSSRKSFRRSRTHLRYPDDYGISVARRGWATAKDVLKTLPVETFLASLKGRKKTRRRR